MGDYLVLIIYLFSVLTLSSSSPLPFGAHPLDEKYYASEVIKCKDGSNHFTRDRINDDFCDCPDGTDEPGTSACPVGRFYCKNLGSRPRFLSSSRINDHICDCCDGSDEYDGVAICPNTCIMGGTVSYHSISRSAVIKNQSSVGADRTDAGMNAQDSEEKLNGLKVLVALQVIVVVIFVAFWVLRRRAKSKRRHH